MKKIILLFLTATSLFLLINCTPEEADIPYLSSLKQADVALTSMNDGQHESLLLGNGDLYGIVWIKEGTLYMRFTKNDIWDARVDVSEDGDLPRIDLSAGKVSGFVGTPPSYMKTFPQPRCAAALRLGPVGSNDKYRATLDLEKAYASVVFSPEKQVDVRILHDRNVILIKSPFDISIEEIKAETLPYARTGRTRNISWLHLQLPGDIDYKGMEYAVALASRRNIKAVSLVTSVDKGEGDVLERAINLAEKTLGENEKSLVSRHEEEWKRFWSASGVQLEDTVMQKWWYRMIYFAGTVCKPGTAPMNLMPPLATDNTPWHCDYHYNYNSWQVFWPLPSSNHADLTEPWERYINSMIPRFRFLANKTFGCEGVFCPISSFLYEPDPAVCKAKNSRQVNMNPWGLTIGMTGMTVQNLWEKHLYQPDTAYFRKQLYPFIKEAALFYTSYVEKCKTDGQGKKILGPSYSPEHGKFGIANCPFDIGYVKYTFDAFIKGSSELGLDEALAERCKACLQLLPPYPIAVGKAGDTVVVDWLGCGYDEVPLHNITVPCSPVFPCDQVTWFSPESEKALFKRTIMATKHNYVNSNVMFNIAKARLSMPEAVDDARNWFLSHELPNGLFVWEACLHGTFMGEMIGLAGLINEYLLQSVDDKIRLFPCWPDNRNASFKGLRARGGFIVSADFSKGKVRSVLVESTAKEILKILSPWRKVSVNGKMAVPDENGLIIFDTAPGDKFLFKELN